MSLSLFRREQLGSRLADGDDKGGQLLTLVMELQFEPFGKQRSQHQLHLSIRSVAFGLRGDVITVRINPGWTAGVLRWLDSVSPLQQDLQVGCAGIESSARR